MEASSESGSPMTLLNEEVSAVRQSAGRNSTERNEEEDLLEEKPQLPPYAPSGGTADHDVNRDPPGEEPEEKPQLPPYASSGATADHDVNRDPPGEEPKEEEAESFAEEAQGPSRLGLRQP
ncbi:hypothetical protein PPTG_01007 [Phytophthora nicotianae INRA-310]|uniref:Uncharacterized protein n=1 Tax=Phytophthora nicotianae (strain INRA-310) TaxID=761204 RepID=W2RHD7_PHYN3|nr:hypothetical protein PPTG_01007 [Phytophthora nicotianae INRA-310]ETN24818.1 hypothetical protein PPTG_01007 [Phytophthora nicotianae INRA-310]